MSATGRGTPRRAEDFYATPAWVTRVVLPHLRRADDALDPCAGEGAILDVLAAAGMTPRGYEIDATRASARVFTSHCDSLDTMPWFQPDLVVMNPPFSFAQDFVERALAEVRPGGDVAVLLRLNMLAGQKRVAFHRSHPADVFILPRRPSFTGGGTDSTDYAWFIWGVGRGNRWQILDVPEGRSRS